jgi:basic amino acid/polyamine antiporter, APA family
MPAESHSFKPTLGLMDATMIVAGSMIGSGIFLVSADIVRNVGSAGWLILVWLITGFMTVTAAVSYGELGGMFPKAGGQYVYLKEAYNPLIGFLYGWSFFSVIQTGTIAAVGVAFSKYAAYLIPALSEDNHIIEIQTGINSCGNPTHFTISAAQLMSIALVGFLTYTNTRGLKGAKWIQNIFTSTKLLALFGLIIAGFLAFRPDVWHANWSGAWQATRSSLKEICNPARGFNLTPIAGAALFGGIAASMVGSIFSSDAWNNVTFIAGEIKNPKKNVGAALFLGTLIVTVIYICANLMYIAVLPLNEIAHAEKDRIAVTASQIIFGKSGTKIIALLIMVSTFGCNNGLILSGARVYYSMARDKLFFRRAGTLNNNDVPQWALWAQFVVASILCLSGKYGDLLDMISFVAVIFYVLTILGIFILRRKKPDLPRPYKAFGYPLLPALYIIMGSAFCVLLIIYKPEFTWPGLIIALLGIPLYFIANSGNRDPVK